MCIAIPGKLIEVHNKIGKVDFNGNILDVNVSLIQPAIGDYILVHAGYAVEVIQGELANEMINLFADLEEVLRDEP